MTQTPFPPDPTYLDPMQRRSNGWAVASLVCGLLCCVPIVTGVLGVIFGIAGVRASRTTRSGRGMAITGIVLGLVFTVGWAGCGGGFAALFIKSKPVREAADAFMSDAAAGNARAAQARCTSSVTPAEIDALCAALSPLGPVKSVSTFSFFATASSTSGSSWTVATVVVYTSNQARTAQLTLVKVGNDYKISNFVLQNVGSPSMPTSAPASTGSARLDRTRQTADRASAAAF